MEITEAAWLAGYIDGDGSLSLTKSSKRWRKPVISIDSADRELLSEVLRITGCGSLPRGLMMFIIDKYGHGEHLVHKT